MNLPNLADAKKINAALSLVAEAKKETVIRAWDAGELLNDAKSKCPHGTWAKWIKENIQESQSTCNDYMKLNSNCGRAQILEMSSIREALKSIEPPEKKSEPAPKAEPVAIDVTPTVEPATHQSIKDSVKNINSVLPQRIKNRIKKRNAERAEKIADGGLPGFMTFQDLTAENELLKVLNKYGKDVSKEAMNLVSEVLLIQEDFLTVELDDYYKDTINEQLPAAVKKREEEIKEMGIKLIEWEEKLARGEVKIPNRMLGQGFTQTEVKKLRSALHPDKGGNAEAFQLFDRVYGRGK